MDTASYWEPKLTTRVLQSPTLRLHDILLNNTSDEVVAVSGKVSLLGKRSSLEGGLLAGKNVEVVIGSVSTSVTLDTDG